MRFEFATAGRIVFGAGVLRQAVEVAAGLGKQPLVVTGSTPERARLLLALLAERAPDVVTFAVTAEPDVEMIRRGTALAREERCDLVVGIGGGAALDAAKAIAILATNQGDVLDYLEIIGRGRTLTAPPLPCIAIPTTAGTGSEVTRNSVIVSREHRVKVSLRSPLMLPKMAAVDPELTYDLPPAMTAATGVDALTQLIEPFVCTRANPLTDGLCREGIERAARSLRRAYASAQDAAARGGYAAHGRGGGAAQAPGEAAPASGGPASRSVEAAARVPAAAATRIPAEAATRVPADAAAREDMALASLFGGLALANAGLGAVHGLAGPLGGMIEAPHGAVCAALLPGVVAANLRALRERAPESLALQRYRRVARLLTSDPAATADDAVEWLRRLVSDLGIPGLRTYGVGPATIAELVEKASRASSMKANPIELSPGELAGIVEEAL